MDSGFSTSLPSKPPDNAPTIPTNAGHDEESESVSQGKAFPPSPPPLIDPQFPRLDGGRRKPWRARQACDNCRMRKIRCDGAKPCSTCKNLILECRYRDTSPPQRPGRGIVDILNKIDGLEENLNRLVQYLPVFNPTRGRQPALTSLEEHLGSQEPIAISSAQREILRDLETAFSQLREFDNWDALGPRLAWYASSLCRDDNFDSRPEPLDDDQRDIIPLINHQRPTKDTNAQWKGQGAVQSGSQSRTTSHERQSLAESEPSPWGTKRKRSSSLHGEPDKPFFCFHQSCGRMYGSGKTLENHLRNHHNGRLPNLPGTCDHEASIKRFSTWEECLEHFIFHQKSGMGRNEYDRALESAEYLISHGNQQVDAKTRISSPGAGFVGGSPLSFGYGAQQSDPRALTTGSNFVWPSTPHELDFTL